MFVASGCPAPLHDVRQPILIDTNRYESILINQRHAPRRAAPPRPAPRCAALRRATWRCSERLDSQRNVRGQKSNSTGPSADRNRTVRGRSIPRAELRAAAAAAAAAEGRLGNGGWGRRLVIGRRDAGRGAGRAGRAGEAAEGRQPAAGGGFRSESSPDHARPNPPPEAGSAPLTQPGRTTPHPKAGFTLPNPTQPSPARPNPARPDATQPNPVQPSPTRPNPAQPDATRRC